MVVGYLQQFYLKASSWLILVTELCTLHNKPWDILSKVLYYLPDPLLSESDRNKLITGAAGVVLGLIMAAGGLIYYKIKHTG